jgi:hypothetical protein
MSQTILPGRIDVERTRFPSPKIARRAANSTHDELGVRIGFRTGGPRVVYFHRRPNTAIVWTTSIQARWVEG